MIHRMAATFSLYAGFMCARVRVQHNESEQKNMEFRSAGSSVLHHKYLRAALPSRLLPSAALPSELLPDLKRLRHDTVLLLEVGELHAPALICLFRIVWPDPDDRRPFFSVEP